MPSRFNPTGTDAATPGHQIAEQLQASAPDGAGRRHLKVAERPISELKPYKRNARRHSDKQLQQIANSIETFGFTNPILIDADGRILAGHGRVEAAKRLGHQTVACIAISDLTDDEKRAYVIADNRIAELAGWDAELLSVELQHLTEIDLSFDVEVTGFDTAEIEVLIDGGRSFDKGLGRSLKKTPEKRSPTQPTTCPNPICSGRPSASLARSGSWLITFSSVAMHAIQRPMPPSLPQVGLRNSQISSSPIPRITSPLPGMSAD